MTPFIYKSQGRFSPGPARWCSVGSPALRCSGCRSEKVVCEEPFSSLQVRLIFHDLEDMVHGNKNKNKGHQTVGELVFPTIF